MNPDNSELVPLPEVSRNGVKIGPRYEGYQILRDNGLSIPESAKALGLSRQRGYQLERILDKRYDLTTKKHLKIAHEGWKKLAQGLPVGSVEKVKDSTVLEACKMVFDRVQPVRREESGTVNIVHTQVYLDMANGHQDGMSNTIISKDNLLDVSG